MSLRFRCSCGRELTYDGHKAVRRVVCPECGAERELPPVTERHTARQSFGLFGGSGDAMMKANLNSVATKFAKQAVRKATGHRMLNRDAYSMAVASLVLGLGGCVIPFVLSVIG